MGEKISKLIPRKFRPTWAEIDLANLEFNYRQIKKTVNPGVKVLAAVKADAYGHGMVQVSRRLVKCGVDYLGVASMDEALVLRESGINVPVLVLGAVFQPQEIVLAVKHNITLSVFDYAGARFYSRHVPADKTLNVHIKIDTGMGRLGIWHAQAFPEIKSIKKITNLFCEGIFTHFPSADTDIKYTHKQVLIFNALLDCLKLENITFVLAHAANSVALCAVKDAHLNMVRPGIMLYGMRPCPELKYKIRLKPVLSLKTRVAFLKTVCSGRSISYGRTFKAKKKTIIATLPVGYADGYPRLLSNKARVIIGNKIYPVAGRVCMDLTMVDLGADSSVKLHDEVILIGQKGKQSVLCEELAGICRTIPYEITCGLSSRVIREFKNY